MYTKIPHYVILALTEKKHMILFYHKSYLMIDEKVLYLVFLNAVQIKQY